MLDKQTVTNNVTVCLLQRRKKCFLSQLIQQKKKSWRLQENIISLHSSHFKHVTRLEKKPLDSSTEIYFFIECYAALFVQKS